MTAHWDICWYFSDSSPALINTPYISRRSNDQALRQTEIFIILLDVKCAVWYNFLQNLFSYPCLPFVYRRDFCLPKYGKIRFLTMQDKNGNYIQIFNHITNKHAVSWEYNKRLERIILNGKYGKNTNKTLLLVSGPYD